ncbi:hypothetical protein BS78_04G170400 [Paspalum vaginatum]|nr:hypothetical protein BS78_04G170400 [Paspalum vaginatum]
MASPPGSGDGASAAVCCMCGDHGLPHELFRCNLCRRRTQHSDLYPRAAGPYRSCNWCLREGGVVVVGGAGDSPVNKASTAAGPKRRRLVNDDDARDDGDDHVVGEKETGCRGCSRSAFSPDLGKPIKKPKKARGKRAVQEQPVVATAARKRREAPPTAAGGKKARFRVKVRRYKLLAEVISAG